MLVNIQFDSVTKTLSAFLDGKQMDNIHCVNIYKKYNDINDDELFSCELVSCDDNKANKVYSMTRVMANEVESGLPAIGYIHGEKLISSEISKELADKVYKFISKNN